MKTKLKVFIKKVIRIMKGNPSHLKIGLKCNYEWYGNTYGGFYVCPDLLSEKSVVYSFGIGEDMSFDNAITKIHNCHVFCFDPTPKSINWFKKQKENQCIHFCEYGISEQNEFVEFYLPKNTDHVSGSVINQRNVDLNNTVRVEMKALNSIMNEIGHKHIDVLKMDIEGAEYNVIKNILENDLSITQILVEFHDRFFDDGLNMTKQAIKMLKDNGYEIFAISDSFEEISFIKKNAL